MKNLSRDITVGMSATIEKSVESADVELFARISGDVNPVHLDDEFAASTRFGKRIAHGLLVASYISAVLGTKLPGPGSIYLNQSLRFLHPVYLGDVITAEATVVNVRNDKPIITLSTKCRNQDGELVLDGEAVLLYDK
ncbi:MAG TPA: MaoC family dehydratase [Chloroflexia bacterium]|jgi:3-hydroxybutyryl-CoA dehydratase